jgi:sulfate/thiosulfate transport system ATP-binding protein
VTIEVRAVEKRFGAFVALGGVSIDVPSGSLTALLGPSGSGKSTLLRVIAGLEPPDSGAVLLNGVDVTHTSPQARGVGFVFQHYAAFKHMTVWDNVAFGLQIRKRPKHEIKARVAELLNLVQLEGYAARYPSQLSGGQRQRMALARALAVQPAVMLLDEPFGALDALTRALMQRWLLEVWEANRRTVLFITHDIDEAIFLGDRVVVMSARPGCIKFDARVELPRPRLPSCVTQPEFVALKRQLLDVIEEESLKTFAAMNELPTAGAAES